MKTKHNLIKIALFASGIAVISLASATAADTEGNISDEPIVVNTDTPANPDALCPNGNPRGTRAENCTVGQKGRRGGFAKGKGHQGHQGGYAKGSQGRQGGFAKGHGKGNCGQVARTGGNRGNSQGRRGMGPGQGKGNGNGPHDGSCVVTPAETVES